VHQDPKQAHQKARSEVLESASHVHSKKPVVQIKVWVPPQNRQFWRTDCIRITSAGQIYRVADRGQHALRI